MCKRKDDAPFGENRCSCDTSEARQARRVNAKTRIKNSPLVEPKPAPHPTTLDETLLLEYTPQMVQEFLGNINFTPKTAEEEQQLEHQISVLGSIVLNVAEEKFGAPTDEQLKTIADEEHNNDTKLTQNLIIESTAARQLKEEYVSFLSHKYDVSSFKISHGSSGLLTAEEKTKYDLLEKDHTEAVEALSLHKYGYKNSAGKTKAQLLKIQRDFLKQKDYDSQYGRLIRERGEAYVKALHFLGVETAEFSTVNVGEESGTTATKALREATMFYPKSWVEKSNQHQIDKTTPLVLKSTSARAHYADGSLIVKQNLRHRFVSKPAGWVPDGDPGEAYYEVTDSGEWVDPKSGIVKTSEDHSTKILGPLGEKAWVRVPYQVYPYPRLEKPKGLGWTEYSYKTDTGGTKTVWRRPYLREEGNGYADVITVSSDFDSYRVTKTAGARVAAHEFAHRMEHVIPGVKIVEDVFLKRRTGQYTANPDSRSNVGVGKIEHGYADNFPTKYAGRTYPDGSREIFSVGMESLFYGTNGGLVGTKGYTADSDYKRTILGILMMGARK